MSSRVGVRLRSVRTVAILGAGLAAATLAGCGTVSDAFSTAKLAPDEFRVVTKAPLVVPPEYALRPPAPGQPRPQELQPESQARLALLGERGSANRSAGELLLVNKAGAEKADPLIRYVVDDQYGEISHKEKPFADRVMFWRKGQPVNAEVSAEQQAANTPDPVDPVVVQKTIASLTGDKAVIIQRAPAKRHLKLPGL